MADTEYMGRIGRNPIGAIAWNAAERVLHARSVMAVAMDPDGRVTCERPCDAVPDEIVGVYNKDLPRFTLERQIRDDVLAMLAERDGARRAA